MIDFTRKAVYAFELMSPLRRTALLRLLTVLAIMIFVGDLAADCVGEVCEKRCGTESSQSSSEHEKGPCQCICATHVGAVIAMDFSLSVEANFLGTGCPVTMDAERPPRLAASIDHPPQLA